MHQWRSEEAAILAGKGTIEIDDPALTVRLVEGKNTTRITFDKNLGLKNDYAFFQPNAPVMVFNAIKNEGSFIKIDFDADVLQQVMGHLFARQIQSVIVEGGLNTLEQFIGHALWDEARVFTTPHILKTGKQAPVLNMPASQESKIDTDLLKIYYRNRI